MTRCKDERGRVQRVFSERTGWDRAESPLAAAVAARRRQGLPVLDLTASNPTRCGFTPDAHALLAPLSAAGALDYEPQPFGGMGAREAVAGYYRDHEAALAAGDICLTTSTSEAYSFLFRLLCDPGDEVLVAEPSYPLFGYLATLENVGLVSYPLVYEHGWQVVPWALRARITARTRAIVLVHPNNPTGHFVSDAERQGLEALCLAHGLALIVDEVFLDYAWPLPGGAERPVRSFTCGPHPVLTFVLSGMSKIAALPQMKLSWIAIAGPEGLRAEACARLEIIADAFLSVNAPVQQALPHWLASRGGIQQQIRERVARNLEHLDHAVQGTATSRLEGEGGWYAVLRTPTLGPDEDYAVALLERSGVLVHPGSAFGFPEQGWLVVSLLPGPDDLRAALDRFLSPNP